MTLEGKYLFKVKSQQDTRTFISSLMIPNRYFPCPPPTGHELDFTLKIFHLSKLKIIEDFENKEKTTGDKKCRKTVV